MEHFLADRPIDRYIVIVPFHKDVSKALTAIERYNNLVLSQALSSPSIPLTRSSILCFTQIKNFKESFGFYEHRTR